MNETEEPEAEKPAIVATDEQLDLAQERGADGIYYLLFTCPDCKRRNRISLKGKHAGDVAACVCGETEIALGGDPGGVTEGFSILRDDL